jgi:hypothetical protein
VGARPLTVRDAQGTLAGILSLLGSQSWGHGAMLVAVPSTSASLGATVSAKVTVSVTPAVVTQLRVIMHHFRVMTMTSCESSCITGGVGQETWRW